MPSPLLALREAQGQPGATDPAPSPSPDKAARDALAQVLRERLAVLRTLDGELATLMEQAAARVARELAEAPSDYQQWVLPRLMENITRLADELATAAAARASDATRRVWGLGEQSVSAPLAAEAQASAAAAPGITLPPVVAQPSAMLGVPAARQVLAIQQFTTSLIKGATAEGVRAINRALGQVVLGAAAPFDAIKAAAAVLPDRTRSQIRGIVNTNLAIAFNSAAFGKLKEQAARDPALRKQWRRSGKVHSRENHDAADGQVQAVTDPFVLNPGDGKGELVKIMYPCEPGAPLKETMNCGCVALPWKATWKMRNPGAVAKPAAPAAPAAPAKATKAPGAKAPAATGKTLTTQGRILAAAAASDGIVRDPTGARLRVDATLAPAGIGDTRLTKAGQDLYSYWAVQTLRRPTEVWQNEHVDVAAGEIVPTRTYLKRFTANGAAWLGRADFVRVGDTWLATGAYRAELVANAIDLALARARNGVRVWPRR